ncbi:MAG: phasin family protein [Moraxellaceae bacterium]
MTGLKKTVDKRLKVAPSKDLRKYTQQIWLAGLGAFARAEEEGGKLFDNLVKIGEDLEVKTREIADNTVGEVRGRVLEKATDTRERVERAFDDRITTALTRLGIPSQRDMDQINNRLDTLTELMQELSRHIRPVEPSSKKEGK